MSRAARCPWCCSAGQAARRDGPPIDSVFIDNIAASAAMTRLLIGRGHRRIAMIVAEYGPSQDARRGLRER